MAGRTKKQKSVTADFPTRLTERMKHCGIRNDALAEAIGKKSSQAISGYRQGNREPDIETLKRIADELNTSIDYLVGRTNDPDPHPDIVQMSKYTGLSSEVIETFHKRSSLGSVISDLLKKREGEILIEFIGRYLFPLKYSVDDDFIEIEIPGTKNNKPKIVDIESLDKTPLYIRTPQGSFPFGQRQVEESLLSTIRDWLINIKYVQRLKGIDE